MNLNEYQAKSAALAAACREWAKGCSCAQAARPQECQECTAGLLAAVLKRAQVHELTIGSNSLDSLCLTPACHVLSQS
jgi:hypothetical protein